MIISLSKFFSAYGSYHNNIVNKTIHMFCIPLILLSSIGMLLYLDKQFIYDNSIYSINIGSLVFIVLMIAYTVIDLMAGLISTLFYGSLTLLANFLYYQYFTLPQQRLTLWNALIYIHIFSWIAQFVGHGFFEKRAPALFDNLLYTLYAPYFVILEVFNFNYIY